jgi:DNA-binding NarL/FixJ family response regulator
VTVRIVYAEDHYLAREGVRRLLEAQPELEIVAACADLPSLTAAIDNYAPDVLLTDIRMPPTGTDEGIRAANYLRSVRPEAGVVVLSQYADPQFALAFFQHGSKGRGYLLKERVWDVDQLVAAVQEVARGGSVVDPDVIDALIQARSRSAASPLRDLTPREAEILTEMAQGKSNAAIAAAVFLSERAVEKHINSIFMKLGLSHEADVNRRVKAVLVFSGEPRA